LDAGVKSPYAAGLKRTFFDFMAQVSACQYEMKKEEDGFFKSAE